MKMMKVVSEITGANTANERSIRILDTVRFNNIPEARVQNGLVYLPEGEYYLHAECGAYKCDYSTAYLSLIDNWSVSYAANAVMDNVVNFVGRTEYTPNAAGACSVVCKVSALVYSDVEFPVTLWQHYQTAGGTGSGKGIASGTTPGQRSETASLTIIRIR